MPVISAAKLKKLSVSLFEKMGVPQDVAQVVSSSTVENCLYGHDTHGMILIPRFIRDLESGKIKPDAKSEVVKKSVGTAWIDGHRGFGQVTMIEAMKTAVDMARGPGVAAVTVTNCNHVGILWSYARTAAAAGMVGIIWCASGPQGGLVVPYGGIEKAIGANPMAVGIPGGEMSPLVLDISTSAVAGGRVILHAQNNQEIPLGWVLDADGKPTTDPSKLHTEEFGVVGSLLPMAGYKGYGLAMVIELLAGVLTGYGPAYTPDYQEGNGIFIIVVDVEKFLPLAAFGKQADALFRHVKSVSTDSETEEIFIPGELEYRTREKREREGIPVPDAVWADITAIAGKLGVS